MQLSALLFILPLAAALPQAPAVEARAIKARDDCSDTQDACQSKCKPTWTPLGSLTYIYCLSSCSATAKWCEANGDTNDDDDD